MVQAKEVDQEQKFDGLGNTPSLSSSKMTNSREAVYVSCPTFAEVHIRDFREGRLYGIIPQKGSQRAVQVSISVIENGHFVAGQIEDISSYRDYEIKGSQIKFNVMASGEDEFDFLVEAPEGW